MQDREFLKRLYDIKTDPSPSNDHFFQLISFKSESNDHGMVMVVVYYDVKI